LSSTNTLGSARSGSRFPDRGDPAIADAEVLPYGLPLHGFLGGVLGVGLSAFVVTGALAGRDGVIDLARRIVRWRVPVRWYLVALFTVPVGATLISLAIYGPSALDLTSRWVAVSTRGGGRRLCASAVQLAKEIGFTGAADPRFVECERAAQVFLGSRGQQADLALLILPRHADD
jgi:hypothetical protein